MQGAHEQVACPSRASARPTRSTASSACMVWEYCGMARSEEGLQDPAQAHPRAARRVLEQRVGARQRRDAEPEPREGRPRGRLPRDGRADGPRRAAPQGELRRPLPRGEPDATRARPSATTRTSSTSPPGSSRATRTAPPSPSCTKSRSSSSTSSPASGVTSERAQHSPARVAPGGSAGRGQVRPLRGPRSPSTPRSSRCSTS